MNDSTRTTPPQPSMPESPATARTWTCPWQRSSGRSGTMHEKNGYIVAREYVDEAESGRIADRPEFRKMIDEATTPDAPFQEILVWKFSRFTRKREHAVAFKSMLRRKGVQGRLHHRAGRRLPRPASCIEGIIESRGRVLQREFGPGGHAEGCARRRLRGFWVASRVPYGFRKVSWSRTGPKKRP